MSNNRNIFIIALIAVVNALGYGIIIPIIYSYSRSFGLSDFQNGLLFASFSLCQFISTPIIGRLSDRFGRRPLLLISLLGTVASFFMMAFASNAVILFIARSLDGLTAGNLPVAQAVISDTTSEKDRAKGFGIIGASFGFGFIFGPAISALTTGYSSSLPFIIAGVISAISVAVTYLFLPETNKHKGEVAHKNMFNFNKMLEALTYENIGVTLLITLTYSFAFSLFIYAFQPFSVKILSLSTNRISSIFTIFGVVGLITQLVLVPWLTRKFSLKATFSVSIMVVALSFLTMFLTRNFLTFIVVSVTLALANALVNPLMQTILSDETDAKSQGTILGIQTSYMSIGNIIGPIAGGGLATISIPFPFLGGGLATLICFFLSSRVLKREVRKESAF